MRRTISALLLGAAVSAAGLVPAGALIAPDRGRHAFKLACHAVRANPDQPVNTDSSVDTDSLADTGTATVAVDIADSAVARPAVTCRWSAPAAIAKASAESRRVRPVAYRLHKAGLGKHRQVIYRGDNRSFFDTDVEPGGRYAYKVEAVRPVRSSDDVDRPRNMRTVGWSNVAVVKVANSQADPTPKVRPASEPKPFPQPEPKPRPAPAPKPVGDPEPKLRPTPEPKPVPQPEPAPRPETKPELAPETRPAPVPEPKPLPLPEPRPQPMKIACDLTRVPTATAGSTSFTPDPDDPYAVACRWSNIAGADGQSVNYRLFKASRDTTTVDRATTEWGVVYRGPDTHYFDGDVSRGYAYGYRVEAVDGRGRIIGRSEIVKVAVPTPVKPSPEPTPGEPTAVEPKPVATTEGTTTMTAG